MNLELNGLAMGLGTVYHIEQDVSGLEKAPIRTSSSDYAGTDGGFVSAQFYGRRQISIKGQILSDAAGTHETHRKTLEAALPINQTIGAKFTMPSGDIFYVDVYVRKFDMDYGHPTASKYKVELIAPNHILNGGDAGSIASTDPYEWVFDGTTDRYIVSDERMGDLSDILFVSAEVQLDSAAQRSIIATRGDTDTAGFYLHKDSTTDNWRFGAGDGTNYGNWRVDAGWTTARLGDWIRVSALYNKGTVTIWVDTTSETAVLFSGTGITGDIAAAIRDTTIGRHAPSNAYRWDGAIRNVRVWDDKLFDTTDVQALIDGEVPYKQNMIFEYIAGDNTGSIVYDSSQTGNNGTFIEPAYGGDGITVDSTGLIAQSVDKLDTSGFIVETETVLPVTSSAEGFTVVTNDGDIDVYPVIRLTGRYTNPRIYNLTKEAVIEVQVETTALDEVVIDMENRTITRNGVSILPLKTSLGDWWTLAPGANSLYLETDSGSDRPSCTVEYRHAYSGA